jgi:mono/diheme cytochrome c family protein
VNVRSSIACIACAVALASAGCGAPEAKFVLSERTRNLHSDAEAAVTQTLDSSFGTPNALVAWLRMPVNFGGHAGTVSDPAAGESRNQFRVDFDPFVETIEPGQKLVWVSGALQNVTASEDGGPAEWTVTAYEPDTMLLTVDARGIAPKDWPAEWQLAADDAFVVAPGEQMKLGRAAYMEHCMHCHGVSGDGDGPTAPYLNPLPRDYRLGIFKFTSTATGLKPTRDDLANTIRQGIPGTYMPSFLLLADDELEAIVEYVRWLSMRGEFEKKLVDEMYADYAKPVIEQRVEAGESQQEITAALQTYLQEDFRGTVDTSGSDLQDAWAAVEEPASVIKPGEPRLAPGVSGTELAEALRQSRERGQALYYSDKAKCATCHGPQGEGNGSETFAFRDIPNTNPVQKYPEPGLFDDWGNKIEPRDLTRGIYRGGRRPIDIYRRITAGIKGTPMPAFTILTEQERWDLVNFVLSIPYLDEPMTPPPSSAPPAPVALGLDYI